MNYAVTELNDTTFNLYSALLAISGILLAVTAATGFGGRSVGARILNGIFAVAFLAYAVYLQFIFTSGTVFISYYVFVVPILLIVQAFRNRTAPSSSKRRRRRRARRARRTRTRAPATPTRSRTTRLSRAWPLSRRHRRPDRPSRWPDR